ncbi:MAG TPA: class I SAM-dependent methyltransferase [Candidatus Sulfotelmatobacter sp.]
MESLETLEQVEREARERLYPSLSNPSWLVLRKRREIFRKWLLSLESCELHVLDVGGRVQPYRPLLKGRLRRYVAIDPRRTPLVDIVGRGEQMPLRSAQFDLIVCTQVLEYAPDPRLVIAEIHRVLKPGGYVMLSVPAVFPQDSEFDSWRFLPPGLKSLMHSFSGFEILPEGGSIAGLFRTLCVWVSFFARPHFVGTLLRFTVIPVLNVIAACLDSLFSASNDQFTANFSVIAQK